MKRGFREKIVDFVTKILGVKTTKEYTPQPPPVGIHIKSAKVTSQFSLSGRTTKECGEEELKSIIVHALMRSMFKDFRSKFDEFAVVDISYITVSGWGTGYEAEVSLIVKKTDD